MVLGDSRREGYGAVDLETGTEQRKTRGSRATTLAIFVTFFAASAALLVHRNRYEPNVAMTQHMGNDESNEFPLCVPIS